MIDKDIYEKLSAYCDGELPADEAVAFERQIAENEELGLALLEMKRIDNGARAAFDDMLDQPVQLKTMAAINGAFSRAVADGNAPRSSGWRRSRWLPAMAAAIGVLALSGIIGLFVLKQSNDLLVAELEQSRQASQKELADLLQKTLETAVSGTPVKYVDPGRKTRLEIVPIHTYKSRSGHWCREFSERIEIGGIVELRKGLACREDKGGWRRLKTVIKGASDGNL